MGRDLELKVAGKGNTVSLAAAIAGAVEKDGYAHLSCIGAAAVNNACKAVAVAEHMVASDWKAANRSEEAPKLYIVPAFTKRLVGDDWLTAMRFYVGIAADEKTSEIG